MLEYSIESIMMSITAYILGVVVTSLIYSKNKDEGLDARLSIYEDVIARLTAGINVMNLRLSQINNSVTSHREGYKASNYKDEGIETDRNKNDEHKSNSDMVTVSNGTTLPILNSMKSSKEKSKNDSMTMQILDILAEGPKTSREIERIIGRSREHTARLMKHLYEQGYVRRDESTRPYVYMLIRDNRDNSTSI
jgi:predicted transcriptional regulator